MKPHTIPPLPATTFQGVVYPWQCDHMGHLNVMHHTGLFDQATWTVLGALGLPAARLRAIGRGMAAVDQHLTYRHELFAGDGVTIRSEVLDLRQRVLVVGHRLFRFPDEVLAAECELTVVHIDTTARKAVPFPASLTHLHPKELVP